MQPAVKHGSPIPDKSILGFRVPFYMISPWTRGNRVFTERADHNSQILFVEEWLAARGYSNIKTDEMVAWRRSHMSNLVNALDLENVSPFPASPEHCQYLVDQRSPTTQSPISLTLLPLLPTRRASTLKLLSASRFTPFSARLFPMASRPWTMLSSLKTASRRLSAPLPRGATWFSRSQVLP